MLCLKNIKYIRMNEGCEVLYDNDVTGPLLYFGILPK